MVYFPKDEKPIKVPRFEESAGFYTGEQRSRGMAKITAKNTKPELLLRKALWKGNIRYRLNSKLPGKPDIIIEKYKLTIFVDGEFWHGRNWDKKKDKIKSSQAFWLPKIERNMQRDSQIDRQLREMGYGK